MSPTSSKGWAVSFAALAPKLCLLLPALGAALPGHAVGWGCGAWQRAVLWRPSQVEELWSPRSAGAFRNESPRNPKHLLSLSSSKTSLSQELEPLRERGDGESVFHTKHDIAMPYAGGREWEGVLSRAGRRGLPAPSSASGSIIVGLSHRHFISTGSHVVLGLNAVSLQ